MKKKNNIHPSAVVHPEAELGEENSIGPMCYIGPNVKIGNGNTFSGYVSIGMPAEHRVYFEVLGKIEIGNHNVVREFVTINSSTNGVTRMGNRCIMLRGSHLSHDSVLEDDCTVSCTVMIGGESHIMTGANLGLGAVIHHKQVVGSYSMLGMGSVVTKTLNMVPGCIYAGNPAKFLKTNDVGLERFGISDDLLKSEIKRWELLRGVVQ